MFFQLLSGQVKFVDKMMQSNYLLVILHVKRKKIVYSYRFYLNLIFDKIQDGCQDGTMFGDVTDLQQRHHQ